MNEITRKDRVDFLDAIRAVAMFMVVGQHAIGYNQLMPNTRSAIAFWFQIGVPIFFLVDGFLFLYRLECHGKFNYTDYVLKSARRLLVPWAGFSLLYLLVRLAYEYIGNPFEQLVLHRGFTDIMIAIWVGASAGQMYFLLSLFILRSLAFATRYIPKLPSITVLCGVGVAGVIWWGIQNGMLPRGFQLRANWGGGQDPFVHAIWGLQYYLLGCSLYLYRAWLFRHARAVASGALLLFAGLSLSGTKWLFVQQYAYLVSVYSMFMVIEKGGGVLSTIGRHTMGVYLLHFPGILKLISVSFALVMDSTRVWYYWLVTLGTYVLSLLVSLQLMALPYVHYLFGETKRVTSSHCFRRCP